MPSLDELQQELRRLRQERKRLLDAVRRGDDDADPEAVSRTQQLIDALENQIRDRGGTPEPATPHATTGGGTPTPKSDPKSTQTPGPELSSEPARPTDAAATARRRVDELRAHEPHPGVRRGPDGTVIGGIATDLDEQLHWREQLNQAEQALAVAEGERAFETGGGIAGVTDADREQLRKKKAEIDRLRAQEKAVDAKIAEYEHQLDEARGLLEANRGQQGKGPGAGAAGAIAGGAAINQRLAPLYKEQARIRSRIAALTREIAALVQRRIRGAIDRAGGVDGRSLPADPVGVHRAEDELLRRVLGRLGIPGLGELPVEGKGLLAPGRRGVRRLPVPVGVAGVGCLPAIAVTVLLVVLATATFVVVRHRGGKSSTASAPGTTSGHAGRAGAATGGSSSTPAVDPNHPAIEAVLAGACANVRHQPPPGTTSPSQIIYDVLVAGADGILPDGARLTLDVGGDAPGTGQVDGDLAEVVVPISHYGSYEPKNFSVAGPKGAPIETVGVIPQVDVTATEGPVGGCTPPGELSAAERDHALTLARGRYTIDDFVQAFGAAHATGNATALVDTLDQLTIDRYGAAQCRSYVDRVVGSFQDPKVVDAAPAPWDYPTDGHTSAVPDAWTVTIDAEQGGSRQRTMAHFRVRDGHVTWFTDCGDPK